MPTPRQEREAKIRPGDKLFDVTCVIGTVVAGDEEMSPHEAAFLLIAQHDAPGTYVFPCANGDEVSVSVVITPSDVAQAYPIT